MFFYVTSQHFYDKACFKIMWYTKEIYTRLIQLYLNQKWLNKKKASVEALIKMCETTEQKDLVFSLLDRFNYLKGNMIQSYLDKMVKYILNCGFTEERTQLVASTFDTEADSGQKILDMIKVPLYEQGWRNFTTSNIIGKAIKIKSLSKGKNQIIIVDEFVGTGQTLKSRVEWLTKTAKEPIEIKCCIMVGMENAIERLVDDSIEIFCPLQLKKGISEYFEKNKQTPAVAAMLSLESKLAQQIKEKELSNYSLGYGKAEALYSSENGNTPNSVFPIFWWIRDNKGNERKTILTRYEKGFE